MFLTIDCPDELLTSGGIPAAMTGAGVRLEAVEELPAGPWLAAVLDSIDPRQLSAWDLPAYLRASSRMQAWAAARVSDGVAELASRTGDFGSDKDIGMALREPVGAAQRRIHHAKRLRQMLPTTRCVFRAGAITRSRRTRSSRRPAASRTPTSLRPSRARCCPRRVRWPRRPRSSSGRPGRH